MWRNPNKDQVVRSSKRLHRRRQRNPTSRLFFIWTGGLHQDQLLMLQLWYVLSMRDEWSSWFMYSLSSIWIPLHNGLKSITTSVSGAFITSSLISSSLTAMAVAPMLFWSGGISEFWLEALKTMFLIFHIFRQIFPNHVAAVVKSRKSRMKLKTQRQARARPGL